jgi:alpha-tubulin suppressor-like RCC1 family protein
VRRLALVAWGCGRIGFAELPGPDAAAPQGAANLVAYANQTCATFAGRAHCWGANGTGQLGDGTTQDRATPTAVALPAGSIDALAIGESHGCASVAGSVACWGTLGNPGPVPVSFPLPVTAISAGRDFTCALAGGTFCWGVNDIGQLGIGTTAPATTPQRLDFSTPQISIDAGDDHACSLATTHTASCWGHSDFGALGDQSGQSSSPLPVTVLGIDFQPRIAGWHACALTTAGTVACWGRGDHGELGDSLMASTGVPVTVADLNAVTALDSGGNATEFDATCAVSGGAVSCWGSGVFGRLGQGHAQDEGKPVHVVGLPGPAIAVALGYDHSCALLADADIWCWGRNQHGQLGDGTTTDRIAPVRVLAP